MTGKNTPSAALLRAFLARIENVEQQQKALSEDKTNIYGEAKSAGFDAKAIRRLIRRRKAKPHDLQEADAIDDLYRHSAGMDTEPPLFRQLEGLVHDVVGGDKLLDVFKQLVPENGEIIATINGKKVRLFRDKDGNPFYEDYVEPGAARKEGSRTTLPPAAKKEVPNCTEDEAEALGDAAAKANLPVIDNPFPYDDARRPLWDLGWRKGTGNDGMEPED